jgi:predicted permease
MDFSAFLNTVITMFVILIVGFVLGKTNVIDSTASKKLSKLIVTVAQPALIINSIISSPYSAENLKLAAISLIIAFAMHFIMALISFVACLKLKEANERKITEFAMVFGNIGFLGIPVLGSLFPENGAFVASFFVVSFNILLWIIGLGIIARGREDIKMNAKKVLINKGTVPSLIGFVVFLIPAVFPQFALPVFVTKSISYIASLCTPVSMLIIGALLAPRSMKNIFGSGKVYYLCLFKLIIIPLVFCFTLKLLGFSDFWVLFVTAVSAMPSASSTSMFAELYDTAPGFSAQGVGTSTLLSIGTMPLIIFIASKVVEWDIGLFNIPI